MGRCGGLVPPVADDTIMKKGGCEETARDVKGWRGVALIYPLGPVIGPGR